MFKSVDTDGSGFIDLQEFVKAAAIHKNTANRDLLVDAFKYFDKDGSGKISQDEIQ